MNAHHERATELLDANFNGPSYVDPTTLGLSIAQTEATLALAYEQRTANLIAFASDTRLAFSPFAEQIAERLGL